MKEILDKLDNIEKKVDATYNRLFVSNGKTALVEEVKQTTQKIDDHIEDNLVSCGGNKYMTKITDRLITGVVVVVMMLLSLGVQTYIKQI